MNTRKFTSSSPSGMKALMIQPPGGDGQFRNPQEILPAKSASASYIELVEMGNLAVRKAGLLFFLLQLLLTQQCAGLQAYLAGSSSLGSRLAAATMEIWGQKD